MRDLFINIQKLVRLNIRIIFGNKFIYFLLSAVSFYVLTVFLNVISDSEITEGTGYNIMLVPSILLIFYPMCFGIQNDQDAKIIEIIFGIPNYRYKVWLLRLFIAFLLCFIITLTLSFLTNWLLVEVSPIELALRVMFPVMFIGLLCFMLSTIIRNGSGTAVVIVIIGLILFILNGFLDSSKWNVFLNPFDVPLNKNSEVYASTVLDNEIIVGICSIVFLLVGLYKTQNREKFI